MCKHFLSPCFVFANNASLAKARGWSTPDSKDGETDSTSQWDEVQNIVAFFPPSLSQKMTKSTSGGYCEAHLR